jgi:FkbM family methyltransferase
LARYRFDIGLRNALRRTRSSSDPVVSGAVPGGSASVSPPRGRIYGHLRQVARKVIRPFAHRLKQYLVGDIALTLEGMRTRVDFQIVSLHQKADELIGRMDTVVQALSAHSQQLSTLTDMNRTAVRRFDDLSIHTRGPVRIDESTFAVRTSDGFVFVPASDLQLLLLLVDAEPGGLEPGTRSVIRRLLRPGMTYVDIGAHIGLLTLAGARAVGPTGRVLGIEPTELTFSLLERSVALNGLSQVQLKKAAAGAKHGRIAFFIHDVLGHNSAYDTAGTRTEVDSVPLDELIAPGEPVNLVKIDVEGAELDVLQGMSRVIAENQDLALIAEYAASHLQRTGHTPAEWFAAFAAHGFSAEVIDEMTGELSPVSELYPTAASVNVLFRRSATSAS